MMMEVPTSTLPLEEVLAGLLAPHDGNGQTRHRLLVLARLESQRAVIQIARESCKELTASTVQDALVTLVQRNIDCHSQMNLEEFALHFEKELRLLVEIDEAQEQAEQMLSSALPTLEDALLQIRALRRHDIAELKAMRCAPRLVAFTFEAVCILMGVQLFSAHSDNWRSATRLMANVGQFLASVESFDKDDVSEQTIRKLRPYLECPEFTALNIRRYSFAAAAFCTWVVAIGRYAVINREVDPLRHKLRLLHQALEDCQRSQPWYRQWDQTKGSTNSTTWSTPDAAFLKAREMLELKMKCFNTGPFGAQADLERADLGQTTRENKQALATLKAWAGNAASVQAAALAARMIESNIHGELDNGCPVRLSPAQMDLCAAMWVPSHMYALEKREHFAALAVLLPNVAPHVTVALKDGHESQVTIGLGPESCGELFATSWRKVLIKWDRSGLDRFQARWRIRTRLASDGSIFDEEDADVASALWTSEEIDMKSAVISTTHCWSYAFADMPAGVATACLSIRFGTEFSWSGWSGDSNESEVLFPAPKPQGRLIVATVSDTAAILQWPHFDSHEQLTQIQYRVVARLMTVYEMESFKSKKTDELDVLTTVIVDRTTKQGSAPLVDLRITSLSPSSSYMFSVDARYLGMTILHWSSSLASDTVVCTRHGLPAAFPVFIRLMGGDTLELEMGAFDNVAVLKRLLFKSICIPVGCQKIHSSSLTLADHRILGDYLDGDALSLDLFVAASVDDVRNLLEEVANDDDGKLDENSVDVLNFSLKDYECGLAVVRLYQAMSPRDRKQFVGTMIDLVDVVMSGRPLTPELESSLRNFGEQWSSGKFLLVEDVFIALAMRGDELALEAVKPLFFHDNADIRKQALAAVMSSADERIRIHVTDRCILMLRSKDSMRHGIPGIENVAALVRNDPKPLLVALRTYIRMSTNSPTRGNALRAMAQLDATSEDTIAATHRCLENRDIELVLAAIRVPVLTIHELEAIKIGNHWPVVKRAAVQAISDRFIA